MVPITEYSGTCTWPRLQWRAADEVLQSATGMAAADRVTVRAPTGAQRPGGRPSARSAFSSCVGESGWPAGGQRRRSRGDMQRSGITADAGRRGEGTGEIAGLRWGWRNKRACAQGAVHPIVGNRLAVVLHGHPPNLTIGAAHHGERPALRRGCRQRGTQKQHVPRQDDACESPEPGLGLHGQIIASTVGQTRPTWAMVKCS